MVSGKENRLGTKLRKLRLDHEQSLQQVADAVMASKAHLWEIETGKAQNPSLDLVRRLSEHFGVTVGWLLGEVPDSDFDDQETLVLYKAVRDLPRDDKALIKSIIESIKSRKSPPNS